MRLVCSLLVLGSLAACSDEGPKNDRLPDTSPSSGTSSGTSRGTSTGLLDSEAGTIPDPTEAEPYSLVYGNRGWLIDSRDAAFITTELDRLDTYSMSDLVHNYGLLDANGALQDTPVQRDILALWLATAEGHAPPNGTDFTQWAGIGGRVDQGLDLSSAVVRSAIADDCVALVQDSAAATHLDGLAFDIEPTATVVLTDYQALLAEVRADLDAASFGAVEIAVFSPADPQQWSTGDIAGLSQTVDLFLPMAYDSSSASAGDFETWVLAGLQHHHDALALPAARDGVGLAPFIPAYSANPWHDPAIENIDTATNAIEAALAASLDVDGVGVYWWYWFYYGEEDVDESALSQADRTAWVTRTLALAF